MDVVKCDYVGEKKLYCNKINKINYYLKLCTFFCLFCFSVIFVFRYGSFEFV